MAPMLRRFLDYPGTSLVPRFAGRGGTMTGTPQGGTNVRKSLVAVLGCALLVGVVAVSHAAAASAKPRIAVLEFKNKADNQWWYHGGATAAQDVFVTELVKSGRFRVVEREQLEALMQEKGLTLSGDVDPKSAIKVGKLLGVNYLLTGSVTEYGTTDKSAHGPGAG